MPSREELKSETGNWLQHLAPWDVFFTGTWSKPVAIDGVLYGMREYLRTVESWAGIPVYAYFGVERGNKGGLLHVHALVGNVGHLKPYCGLRLAPNERGLKCCLLHAWRWGYARAVSYDPALGAAYYVSKYVVKNLAEFDFVGFPAHAQASLGSERYPVRLRDERIVRELPKSSAPVRTHGLITPSANVERGFFRRADARTEDVDK